MSTERGAGAPGTEELLRPTLQDHREPVESPWRVESQFYVGFFGGPLAIGTIAFLNGGRLGVDRKRLLRVLWIVAGVLAAELVAVYALAAADVVSSDDGTRALRLANQAAGVVAYPLLARVQRPADRVFRLRHEDEDYASLWGPGFLAVVAGAIVGTLLATLPLRLV